MKIGVIGAGTMGQGIAKAFAQVEGNTVALCDIKQEWAENGLKKINDLQGHQAGDALIRRTAECLLQAFGKKAYRIGGDEFIVIDRESGREAFHACAENALRAMEESHISISCGISWRAEQGNIDEQINEADKKMYLAKRDFYACKEHDRRHYWPEQE